MKRTIFTALTGIAIALPGLSWARKGRPIPLDESVCQADIVVVGSLHIVLPASITVTTTASDLSRWPTNYDQGQVGGKHPDPVRFIKNDPWLTTVSVVNVVLPSTSTASAWEGDRTWPRDDAMALWLLHRENILGQYFVLKRLPLSEEPAVKKLLAENKCGKKLP